MSEIAEGYACLGVVLREWIRREDDREAAYQDALDRKREMRTEALMDRTAAAAFSTVQDAQTSSGDWLEVAMWPKGLLAAASDVEFGPDGRPYKIKMDSGKHQDRLSKMLGLDKSQQTTLNIASLVNVLSEMPNGAPRIKPGAQGIEDATYVAPAVVAAPKADAPETAAAATPAGTLLPGKSPGLSVIEERI